MITEKDILNLKYLKNKKTFILLDFLMINILFQKY